MEIDLKQLEKAVDFLETAVHRKIIPGAVLRVNVRGHTVIHQAVGYAHYERKIPMTNDTIFDLASLTKVCATLPAIMVLLEDGELSLEDSVSYYLPQFQQVSTDIKLRHLLTHTSGMPASLPFYEKGFSLEQAIDEICNLSLPYKPDEKVIYSDLNFILLGHLVHIISGLRLDQFSTKFIFEPLEMKETGFNPPSTNKKRMAATEYRTYLNDYQWGSVHDENAVGFGGVSGHAGLFSTTNDLSRYAESFLNKEVNQGYNLFSPYTIDLMNRNFTAGMGLNRGLGWQLPDDQYSPVGELFPQTGLGHTGFTGTSMWMDRKSSVAIILLTNCVHFGRSDQIIRVRRILHNIVVSALRS